MDAVRTSFARNLVFSLVLLALGACGGDPATSNTLPATPPPTAGTVAPPATGATPPAAPVTPAGTNAGSPAPIAGSGALSGAAGRATPAAGGGAGAASPAGGAAGGPQQPAAGSGMPPLAGTGGSSAAGDPADADIENCYELRSHGAPMPGDKSRYQVPTGETYTGFIFKTPWTTPVQGLRFRHLPDNKAVLHHWLLYAETGAETDGNIDACPLDGPTGFLCGQASTRTLITGWAPGRGDFRLPPGVGLELPTAGALLAVEFHYFNSSGAMAEDQSGVEVCVTSKFRPNTASITWLGTQQINVAAGMTGTASGTCKPLRTGMAANEPIHVLFSWPHMHKLGNHLKSVVTRAAGGQDVMYDGAFSFDMQLLHDTPILLQPGDSVTTTCTFQNTTAGPVGFGQSTQQEMCYNFTYAWPAHALDNPGAELGGASNTCLH